MVKRDFERVRGRVFLQERSSGGMRLRFSSLGILIGGLLVGMVLAAEGHAAMNDETPSLVLETAVPEQSINAFGDNGSKAFSWRFGKGYSPVTGMTLSPYWEIAAISLAGGGGGSLSGNALGALDRGFSNPKGRFLMGGLATYRIAPRWKASFDFAVGQPLLSDGTANSQGLMSGEGDDLQLILRSRVRLGYVVGTNFSFVTSINVVRITPGASAGMTPIGYGDIPMTSFNLGFSYRFR